MASTIVSQTPIPADPAPAQTIFSFPKSLKDNPFAFSDEKTPARAIAPSKNEF